jgi:hypothetical protein
MTGGGAFRNTRAARSSVAKNNGVDMAIKLLGHVWRAAASTPAGTGALRHGNDWAVESREPSQWNPGPSPSPPPLPPQREQRAAEPVWAETQPWCHD